MPDRPEKDGIYDPSMPQIGVLGGFSGMDWLIIFCRLTGGARPEVPKSHYNSTPGAILTAARRSCFGLHKTHYGAFVLAESQKGLNLWILMNGDMKDSRALKT